MGIVGVSIAFRTLTFRVRGALRGRAGTGSGRWCFGAVRVRRSRARHRCVTGRPFGRLFDQDTVSTLIGRDEGYDTNVFAGTTRAFGASRELPFNIRTVDSGNLGDVCEHESNEYDNPHVPGQRQIYLRFRLHSLASC